MYAAWATTPNLSFDESELGKRLPQLAKKTLQRYEHFNLNIQSFGIRMYKDHSLARELILKAIKLGATDLTIHVPDYNYVSFVLPDEVLESQTLNRLSASCCTVDLGRGKKKEVIPCFTLKSLNLFLVTVNGDDLFKDLSSRFPLIEELTLKRPESSHGTRLALDVGAMTKLHKLKYLRMEGLDIKDSLSKHDLWPQFPYLKELVVHIFEFSEWNDVRICSPSLERIVILIRVKKLNAEFDVPNIRYLKLRSVDGFPRLKFETTMMSREWASDMGISRVDCSFFYKLKQFVNVLSRVSRVSLHIDMERGNNWEEGYVGDDDGLGAAELENLTLQNIGVTSAFLGDLLRSCRLNFIYIRRWEVQEEALQQLRRLPWKTNAFSSLNPRYYLRFQPKYFNDSQGDLDFCLIYEATFSDTEYDRFQLR